MTPVTAQVGTREYPRPVRHVPWGHSSCGGGLRPVHHTLRATVARWPGLSTSSLHMLKGSLETRPAATRKSLILNGARGRNRTGMWFPTRDFKSLASTCSATRADTPSRGRRRVCGGWGRNRTGVHGFAGRCMTTLPPSRRAPRAGGRSEGTVRGRPRTTKPLCPRDRTRGPRGFVARELERETRLELATPTLARLCSTN